MFFPQNAYSDVTIACDGKVFETHKLVLSTCSEYFANIFKSTGSNASNNMHPIIILNDVKPSQIEALLNYMYIGEVNVLQSELGGLIKAAEYLKIKGLAVPEDDPSSQKPVQDDKPKMIIPPQETLKRPVHVNGNNAYSPSPPAKKMKLCNDTTDASSKLSILNSNKDTNSVPLTNHVNSSPSTETDEVSVPLFLHIFQQIPDK